MCCLYADCPLQFVFFMMPEVSGYPLERVKELFEKKRWYLIGCTQNRPLRMTDTAADGDVPQLVKESEDGRVSQDGEKEGEKYPDENQGAAKNTTTRTQTADA